MTDERTLVDRAREGDHEAFAALVRAYQVRVRGYCRNTLREATLAEDAAQDIFLKAYQGLRTFRGDSAFSSWLFRIMVNHCRDLIRQLARRRTESLDALREEDGDRIDALVAAPPVAAQRLEHAETLRAVLTKLPEAHREILLLREGQGLSYDELAAALNCSQDAVRGRLKRARKELAGLVRHFFPAEASKLDRG